jgi:hypothetical protein
MSTFEAPKSRNPETGAYQGCQLTVAKVFNSKFRGKVRNLPRHFKGHFSIGNVQLRILPGQPTSPAIEDIIREPAERAAIGELLQLDMGLSTPKSRNLEVISAKVSSGYHGNSHFWETRAGDPVRSPLRAEDVSRPFE